MPALSLPKTPGDVNIIIVAVIDIYAHTEMLTSKEIVSGFARGGVIRSVAISVILGSFLCNCWCTKSFFVVEFDGFVGYAKGMN